MTFPNTVEIQVSSKKHTHRVLLYGAILEAGIPILAHKKEQK